MTKNRLLSAYALLVWSLALLLFSAPANAQKVYPGTTVASSNGTLNSNVTSPANAGGNDLANAARISSTLLSNGNYVEVNWGATPVAATPVYIKVTAETGLLTGVLGGAVGNLVSNLAAILLDGQYIRVTAYNGTTARNSGVIDGNTVNETSANIKLVQDATGVFYIKFTPNNTFTSIKIENFRSGVNVTGSKWLDVYGAYYASSAAACAMGNYTSYTGGGLLAADITAGAGNVEGYKAIDNSPTTFSKLSIGTLGVSTYVQQDFYFEGTSSTTDKYSIRFKISPALVQAGILSSISIRGYSGTNTTPVYTATAASLLNSDLLGLLQNNQATSVTVTPGVVIDRLSVRLTGLVSASIPQELDIFSVTKGNFDVTVNGGGSVLMGATVSLTASITGCSSSYTYAWSGGLTSTTNTTVVPTTAVGTTTYTVTVTDAFGIQKMASTSVTVLQPPVAGSITGGGNICYGNVPGSLTLSGQTGTIARWEKADNSNFTNATTIANSAGLTSITGAQIGALTQTTYVRAVIQFNGYPDAYPTAIFNVKTSTWDGTSWSPAVPDINTLVRFTGNYNVAANIDACALEVSNNAIVNIPSEYTVTVNGYVHVSSGSFTLQHNAHLVQLTDAINQGNITQIRNSQPLYRLDYTLWSAPVTGQLMQTFSPATATTRFYDYYYAQNTTTNQWIEGYWSVDPATTSFQPAHSYLIRMPNENATTGYNAGTATITFTGSFTGAPNNGTIQRPLSTLNNRFTPVGNPYPSPINVRAFFDANTSVLQPGSTLYFWRKKNNSNASSYATLSRDAYVSNHAIGGNPGEEHFGGDQWETFFNSTVSPTNWIINPGQGFIVKTATGLTNPRITFNNAMRKGNHNAQFFRTAEPETLSRYWMEMKGVDSYSQMALVYSNTATLDLDSGRDAMIMGENNLGFYSVAVDTRLTIQARPEFAESDVVTLGYKALNAGQYTINVMRKDGVFNDQKIYLRDNTEGVTRELADNAYTFSTEAGTFNDRFEVIYTTTALSVDNPAATPKTVMVYKTDNVININAGTSLINSVKVYDMRGRVLYESAEKINNVTAQVNGLTAQTQILLVEVNTVNGTVTKKIAY